MSRPRSIALGALAAALLLVVALVTLAPEQRTGLPALLPARDASDALATATAGPGRLTPALRAEIDRVLEAGSTTLRSGRAATPGTATKSRPVPASAADLARCAEFEGQRYCLQTGWTTRTPAEVAARATLALRAAAPAARGVRRERTGDLDLAAALARVARMSPRERRDAERAELEAAARSVAKVWLLRHQIEGVPLPRGFLAEHPEVTVPRERALLGGPMAPPPKTIADYPERRIVLRPGRTVEQVRNYWCGPAAMQMIWWGWHGRPGRQRYFARQLGTTRQGSSISEIVRVTNELTGWDRRRRAGRYVVLDIGRWRFPRWLRLQMRHVADYRAPVVLHPVLEKQFFPYLDDDASGHFQVGRGYDKNGPGPALISFFEPWNQQRFDPSEPFIPRLQWRNAYRSFRANQAHPDHNIGV